MRLRKKSKPAGFRVQTPEENEPLAAGFRPPSSGHSFFRKLSKPRSSFAVLTQTLSGGPFRACQRRSSAELRFSAVQSGRAGSVKSLNEVYSSLAAGRRYEVWFVRLGLADHSGAWWFRYLLLNPGRGGCPQDPRGMPVQVWATWFPAEGKPRSVVQGYPLREIELSPGQSPFHFRVGANAIDENSSSGAMEAGGCAISWELHYRSTFSVTLSNKGWIGFSRTPHSDAVFSGWIKFDGRIIEADPLGFGVQGHNCGYRHRNTWTWAHAYLDRAAGPPSTFEALTYEMPFGLLFQRAVLWHSRERYVFRKLLREKRDPRDLQWSFGCSRGGLELEAAIDGSGPGMHRLAYLKTDCRGDFDVLNNSLARAVLRLQSPNGSVEELKTCTGGVLEMAGG